MKSIRGCEIVSRLEDGEKTLFDTEKMKQILEEKKCIQDYCYIIHDKDTYTEEEEKQNPDHKAGELKPPHIHLLLRFERKQPQKLEYVAKWFDIPANFINTVKNWDAACLYQIHKNAPDKYAYSVEDVTANFDYEEFLKEAEEGVDLKKILKKILSGEIREYNKTLKIDNLTLVYNSRLINEAFKIRMERLQATEMERNMECIMITGDSSSGKTTLAKKIALTRGLDYFVSSGNNDVMDSYAQQPCILLDEIRPSSLGLSDLLKMLDPYTASSVKSRFKNKYLNCELIIMTTVLDIDTFYRNVFSDDDEPIIQLKRRCRVYIKMNRKKISVSMWDDKMMRYSPSVIYKNDLLDQYIPKKAKTVDDVKEHMKELIPFLQLDDTKDTTNEETETFTDDCGFCLTRIPDEEIDKLLGKVSD